MLGSTNLRVLNCGTSSLFELATYHLCHTVMCSSNSDKMIVYGNCHSCGKTTDICPLFTPETKASSLSWSCGVWQWSTRQRMSWMEHTWPLHIMRQVLYTPLPWVPHKSCPVSDWPHCCPAICTSKTSVGSGRNNFTKQPTTLGRSCTTAGPAPKRHQSNRTPHSSNTLLTFMAMEEVRQTAPTQQETQYRTPLTCFQTADRQVVDGWAATHSLHTVVECSEGLRTFR